MILRTLTATLIICFIFLSNHPLFAQTTTDFLVNWVPNPEPTVTGYVIYRSLDRDAQFTAIDSVDANTHSYLDTGVPKGTRYYYRLIAKDNSGERSPFSNPVSGLTIAQDADDTAKDACRITDMNKTAPGSYDINWSTLGVTVGFIQYDNDAALDSLSTWDNQYSMTHTNPIQGLELLQTYYVRAVSYDSNDNMIISAIDTLVVRNNLSTPQQNRLGPGPR